MSLLPIIVNLITNDIYKRILNLVFINEYQTLYSNYCQHNGNKNETLSGKYHSDKTFLKLQARLNKIVLIVLHTSLLKRSAKSSKKHHYHLKCNGSYSLALLFVRSPYHFANVYIKTTSACGFQMSIKNFRIRTDHMLAFPVLYQFQALKGA